VRQRLQGVPERHDNYVHHVLQAEGRDLKLISGQCDTQRFAFGLDRALRPSRRRCQAGLQLGSSKQSPLIEISSKSLKDAVRI
jgi:hypothetical protein